MSKWHITQALFLCLVASLFCTSRAVQAQGDETQPPSIEGRDPLLDASYATEPVPSSGFDGEAASKLIFDDNIFNNNAEPRSDFLFQESALLNLWKKRPTWNIGLQYEPTLLLYSTHSSLDTTDQSLKFAGNDSLTPRLHLQWSEAFNEFAGILLPASNQFVSLPVGPPPTLNTTLATPLSRNVTNAVAFDGIYDTSMRGSLDLSAAYNLMHFYGVGGASTDLLNTTSPNAGASYQYRVTERVTVGGKYLFQSFHYGTNTSDQVQSAYMTLQWALGQRTNLNIYAGPQYATGGLVAFAATNVSPPKGTWLPAGGGNLTFRSNDTVVQFAAERTLSSGGGLLGTVTNTYVGGEVRHLLTNDWDFLLVLSDARAVSIPGNAESGKVGMQTVGGGLEHPLLSKLNIHFEYDYLRERINQFVPLGANANASQLSVAMFYRFGGHRL